MPVRYRSTHLRSRLGFPLSAELQTGRKIQKNARIQERSGFGPRAGFEPAT
jgi:hypothetical protein